ncbi:MAG: hypothetical protein LBF61_09085 [Azoarcus sp.]|jgi:hypothetical protein|nr:hypothetical protein [Azoarcus sp.]
MPTRRYRGWALAAASFALGAGAQARENMTLLNVPHDIYVSREPCGIHDQIVAPGKR